MKRSPACKESRCSGFPPATKGFNHCLGGTRLLSGVVLFTKLIQQNTSKVGKFVIMSDDGTNEPNDLNNDTLNYDDPHRPWTMVVRERSICTANVFDIQKELIDNNKHPINRNDKAEALHKQNFLRQTKVIQISSNIKCISIQFDTSTIMQTFCSETLELKDQFSILFQPDFRKCQLPPITYT